MDTPLVRCTPEAAGIALPLLRRLAREGPEAIAAQGDGLSLG